MKKLYTVEINTKQILERYDFFNKIATKHNSKLMVGLKDGTNGWGNKEAYNFFKSRGITSFFWAYPGEIMVDGIWDDETTEKFAWTWTPDADLLKIKNLTLVCSNRAQIDFCKTNSIPYYVWFDVGMTRNGFILEDNEGYDFGGKEINVFGHCPYSEHRVKIYENNVYKLLDDLKERGFTIKDTSFLASNPLAVCDKYDCDDKIFGTYCRISMGLTSNYNNDSVEPKNYYPKVVKTWVMNVRNIPKDAKEFPIGYDDLDAVALGVGRVAVLPVGYYHFAGINSVYILGRVCKVLAYMQDSMVVNITYMEATDDEVLAAPVELIGPHTYSYNRIGNRYSDFSSLQYKLDENICDIKYND